MRKSAYKFCNLQISEREVFELSMVSSSYEELYVQRKLFTVHEESTTTISESTSMLNDLKLAFNVFLKASYFGDECS